MDFVVENVAIEFKVRNEIYQKDISQLLNYIKSERKFFTATSIGNKVIIKTQFTGTRFNRLQFVLDEDATDRTYITCFPDNGTNENYFVGGTDTTDFRMQIDATDLLSFTDNIYVPNLNGFGKIDSISLYLDEEVKNINCW